MNKIIYTPYHYLFYLIYKFVKFTTKSEQQHLVLDATLNALLFSFTGYSITFYIIVGLASLFPADKMLFGMVFITPLILLYIMNRYLFLKKEKYRKIEAHYDQNNKLKKGQFIVIAITYMLFSICTPILAGIHYSS